MQVSSSKIFIIFFTDLFILVFNFRKMQPANHFKPICFTTVSRESSAP